MNVGDIVIFNNVTSLSNGIPTDMEGSEIRITNKLKVEEGFLPPSHDHIKHRYFGISEDGRTWWFIKTQVKPKSKLEKIITKNYKI